MRYLIAVIDTATNTGGPDEMVHIDAFNDKLEAEGHWVMAGGIMSPDTAKVIDNRDDAGIITDGPLHVTEEYMSGFWVIDAPDDETALRLATEGSKACNRKVQLRRFIF
jgi:hypothetical protein